MTASTIVTTIMNLGGRPLLLAVVRKARPIVYKRNRGNPSSLPSGLGREAPPDLAEAMRLYRQREQVTVQEAAVVAGVAENTWRDYERGRRTRGCAAMRKIVEAVK